MNDQPAYWTARRAAAAVAAGEVSATELVQQSLDRIDRYDHDLNAVALRFDEQALAAAAEADRAVAAGASLGPLHGLPVSVKEAYDLVGTPSTWGRTERADHRPDADATVVTRLREAGAIIVAKTNVPEHLADWQSNNPVYGRANNPWALDRTPGGSSGGSAIALAAGYSYLEAGSDIGGSLRNPAHYCGVSALKPTYGVVPTTGHALTDNLADGDLAVCGPMARTVDDVALGFDVVAGFDSPRSPGERLTLPMPRVTSLRGARIAVCLEEPVCRVAADVRAAVSAAADAAEAAGAIVTRDVELPVDSRHSHDVYIQLLRAVGTDALSPVEFADLVEAGRTGDPDDWRTRVARAQTQSHADWLRADLERSHLRRAWAGFFERFDVLLCPVAPTAAWHHDTRDRFDRTIDVLTDSGREQIGYYEQLFWAGINIVALLPSVALPGGLSAGLPVGLQLIGPHHGDRTCLQIGAALESELAGFQVPPRCA